MGDLISDGTGFQCTLCTAQLKLAVLSSSAEGDSKTLATDGNFLFPPPPGAQCLLIPNAPAPCAPPNVSVTAPGQSAVDIDGQKALGAGCSLQCAKGGALSMASSGQSAALHDGAESGKDIQEMIAASTIIVPLEAQQVMTESPMTKEMMESSSIIVPLEAQTPPGTSSSIEESTSYEESEPTLTAEENTTPETNESTPTYEDNDIYPHSAYNGFRLRNQLTAHEIGHGHAFDKHVVERGEFPGLSDKPEFCKCIMRVLSDPSSRVRMLVRDRIAVWHPPTETIVIIDPTAKDRGTCFKPTSGRKYFIEGMDNDR